LPAGTDDGAYRDALMTACDAIAAFEPGVVIVSLGVDTFHNDPISDLAVTTEGFREQGELVAQLALPTVILQEGGYDVDAIGDNVRAFLLGITSRV
jgi:acetoin utilization deacetylase AcuC-like enzyme